MENNVLLHKIGTAQFIQFLKDEKASKLGAAKHRYLLCTAILHRRKSELAERHNSDADASALQRMIVRLEASRVAHIATIKRLEDEQ